jgi:uncharacterized membrane protein YdjX (TVP38/TMEM64 family)
VFKIYQKIFFVCVLVVFVGVLAFFFLNIQDIELLTFVQEHRVQGAVLFSLIMFSTTVVAPLTALPLVPLIAPLLGPFTTGLACFVGWFLGALCAFVIGRSFGRPVVAHFVSLESFAQYEKHIQPEMAFVAIVALRMLLPVDVLSYLLGVLSRVSLGLYAGATALGIVWFSFSFAYFGEALFERNYVLLTGIGVASVLILYGAWRYTKHIIQK